MLYKRVGNQQRQQYRECVKTEIIPENPLTLLPKTVDTALIFNTYIQVIFLGVRLLNIRNYILCVVCCVNWRRLAMREY